jgi:hypothetical protein
VATAATALPMPPLTVTLPLLLPVGELEPTLLTLDAGAGIKEPDAVTDKCSELASVTGNITPTIQHRSGYHQKSNPCTAERNNYLSTLQCSYCIGLQSWSLYDIEPFMIENTNANEKADGIM